MTHTATDPDEPPSRTAGEEDHEDPEVFRGEPTDPPPDVGKPPRDAP